MVHSIGEARFSDEKIDGVTDSRVSGFDRAWMPASFLRRSYNGVMTGFKYSFRDEARGFERSEPRASLADQAADNASRPRQFSSFRLEVSGQWRADRDLDEMGRAPILVGRKALEQIEFREADEDGGDINLAVYSFGKMIGHGTSLNLHLSNSAGISKKYGSVIRSVENEHSLGWDRTAGGSLVHRGAPFIVRFPESFVVTDLQELAGSIFRATKPFRLFGLYSESSERRVDIEAIDLHTGDPLSVELTKEWMRVFLPRGSCGNVLARLYTNLQHAVHSDLRVVSGSGIDVFGDGSSYEA
jgi:hypothetical protein